MLEKDSPFHTLTGTDFELSPEELQFTVDGQTEQCAELIIYNDDIVEQEELLFLTLSGSIPVSGLRNRITFTISDNSSKFQSLFNVIW